MSPIRKFPDWLSVRPTWWELAVLVAGLFAAYFVWMESVRYVFELLYYGQGSGFVSGYAIKSKFDLIWEERGFGILLVTLVVGAFYEEVLFRCVPLGLVLYTVQFRPHWRVHTLSVVLVISTVFGLIHAPNYNLPWYYAAANAGLTQGMFGLLYGILFLKVAGLRYRHTLRALGTVMTAHTLWNLMTVMAIHYGILT